ncbi:MAG: class I SAM-dependent methyltransferase [Arenicellales bacterium]|jgi:malonyl-CoA O-methyltransferase|nr:class I SAM-dependent methyltransferase [Arenicellales bacterium]|tara:strand:+ start:342 stop:1025 length:684 start_codon:yes stop_codon:yes gene_type:complete
MSEITDVQSGYDRWAAVYDYDQNPLLALEAPLLRKALGDVCGCSVLDLGCGTGRHALWLAEAGAHVTAIDFSEDMLAVARSKRGADGVDFMVHDLHERLPFGSGAFDIVVSGLVLEHLRDLPAFFSEARRVLNSRGRAVISAMHPAMFLRDSQAQFTDPASGEIVRPGSLPHQLSEMIMAAVLARLDLIGVDEYPADRELVARFPRAKKYLGWPMLVVLQLASASNC